MKPARPARLVGSAWELVRIALLLSTAARIAAGDVARLAPLLVPLAAPGLVMAGGFAAGAFLADVHAGLLPLMRMGKALELASGVAAMASMFLTGAAADTRLVLLLAVTIVLDLTFLLVLLSSRGDGPEAAPPPEQAPERPPL